MVVDLRASSAEAKKAGVHALGAPFQERTWRRAGKLLKIANHVGLITVTSVSRHSGPARGCIRSAHRSLEANDPGKFLRPDSHGRCEHPGQVPGRHAEPRG